MLSPDTLQFLSELSVNNNKPWYLDHKKEYEAAKEDFELLVGALIKGLSVTDKDIAELEAKHCTFRQYRDVRFSKDKRPYKINMGAYLNKGGKKINTAGYYLHLEPGKSMVAGGLWMPEGPLLAKVRQEIDYNLDEWNSLLSNKAFKKRFPSLSKEDMLKRPPKGYNEDNPAVEHLKLKSYIARQSLPDDILVSKKLQSTVLSAFNTLKPFIDFLNRAIE